MARRSASCLAHLEAEGRHLSNLTPADVHNLAQFGLVDLETLSGTPIHPIWSVDRNDWVPLGELTEGETLQSAEGIATVLSLTLETCSLPVYNIETHGEYVHQVGDLGLLVHNTCATVTEIGGFMFSQTVANHLDDVVTKGPFKRQAARPFLNSPLLLKEIMASGKGVPDKFFEGALRWEVAASFRGAKGTWELVIDMRTNTILHWNFVGL